MIASLRALTALVVFVGALGGTAFAQSAMTLPEPVGMDGDPAAKLVLDGNASFLHGDLVDASKDYRLAIRRKPDFAVATFNLGLVEFHQGNRTRGLDDMDRGIGLATKNGMDSSSIERLRKLRAAFIAEPVST